MTQIETTDTASPRAAIVGAGPSGFYTAQLLLDKGFAVDVIDALPTPFGLVRAGVAPDHPNIKAVTRVFEKIASKPGFRFFGGITLGRDVSRTDLVAHYHAVVYATGMSRAAALGIDGEDRPGSHGATEFVAWYNGHPDAVDHTFELTHRRAVVVGNGNVALDVARMLALSPDELRGTDMADHAIDALSRSSLEEVVVLGRRGPVQAAFTNPELRELAELDGVDIVVDPAELELDPQSTAALTTADDATRLNLELLGELSTRPCRGAGRRIVLRFLQSPVEITGAGTGGRVTGVRSVTNRIEVGDLGRPQAIPTGQEEVIDCGLVFRAVGYRGRAVPGLPFDDTRGLLPNVDGRLCAADGSVHRGEYVVGWIKRGPSGVIGTNKKDAMDTVARILHDRDTGELGTPTADGEAAALSARTHEGWPVDWPGWRAIDDAELAAGRAESRPRVKFVRRESMYVAAGGAGLLPLR